jgi:hypothetical protein
MAIKGRINLGVHSQNAFHVRFWGFGNDKDCIYQASAMIIRTAATPSRVSAFASTTQLATLANVALGAILATHWRAPQKTAKSWHKNTI